jgi:DNA-binding beta-propeller fold protein YncE
MIPLPFLEAYMKTMTACALYVSAAAALLAACSGNSVSLTAPAAPKQSILLSRSASYLYLLCSECGGNSRGCVVEYAVGQYKEPIRMIEHGIYSPTALAFDSSANLYVANFDSKSVKVYAPGKITPTRSISGPGFPVALTFDKSGNLFVANERADKRKVGSC